MLSIEQKQRIKQCALNNPCYGINIYGREFINKHLKSLNPKDIILELGTWMGGTIQYLAKNNPNLTFHTIDICDKNLWYSWYATNPKSKLFEFLQQAEIENIEPDDIIYIQRAHIEDYTNIINHVGDSISLDIKDISALLIDANHNEEYVSRELEYYFPRMRQGGYIFLDDFYEPKVKAAVKQFIELNPVRLKSYGDIALLYVK